MDGSEYVWNTENCSQQLLFRNIIFIQCCPSCRCLVVKVMVIVFSSLPCQQLDPETLGLRPCTSSPSPRWAHHGVHTSLSGHYAGCYALSPRAKEMAEISLCLCKENNNLILIKQNLYQSIFCFESMNLSSIPASPVEGQFRLKHSLLITVRCYRKGRQ